MGHEGAVSDVLEVHQSTVSRQVRSALKLFKLKLSRADGCVQLGGDATVEHRPQRPPLDEKGSPAPRDASTMVGAYCVARLRGVSRPIIEWMFIDEIEPMRRRGASGHGGRAPSALGRRL